MSQTDKDTSLAEPAPHAIVIREQLRRLGAHPLFTNSERYQVLLTYIAEHTLLGNDYDFAFIKSTPIPHRGSGGERMDLQFGSELFNLLNIVNMGLPANTLNGSGFGEISKTARTSRQIQFSLKLIY